MIRPKVIFVNRVFWPNEAATAQLLTDLARALVQRGWTVHVITHGSAPPNSSIMVHDCGTAPSHRIGRYVHFLRRARQLLRSLVEPGDIVVLKTDPPMLAAAATEVARSRGGRVVQWIQDIYPEIVSAHVGALVAPALWPLRLARNRAWRRSAAAVTLSPEMASRARANGCAEVEIIPNWAAPEIETARRASDTVAARQQVRRGWGIGDEFLAVYSGNLGRVHELDAIIDAATRLRDERNIRFAFVGSGPRLTEAWVTAETRQLTNVAFHPAQPRPRLGAALAAADVHFVTLRPGFESLVSPSKFAGIVAAGRPAIFIGPVECSLAREIRESGCGLCFRPDEADALVAALRRLQQDPEECSRLRAAAEAVAARYGAERAFSAWDALLHRVAGTNLPRAGDSGLVSPGP